jgi:flavin-dependent dehydrogenase
MYDAIIVGARCAGSPLAMLLARKGHSVLAVDKSAFPSDIMSTHFIQPDGVAKLEKWGLLDAVRATNCPPITKMSAHIGGMAIPAPPPPEGALPAYCPRRTVLDKILVDGARAAGAEVRERFSVQDVTTEDGRVTGIRGRDASGADVVEQAQITVGADGIHSLVARAVNPAAYDEVPALTCGYYSYFSGVPMDGAEFHIGEGVGVLAFPTNDGLVCIAVGRPIAAFQEYRSDYEANFMQYLAQASPDLAARVWAGKREERFIGTADTANYFRKPYGPGWALVGDAGYHRDPVTGLGIADAFRDAELLADAMDEGFSGRAPLEDALAEYERKRNEIAKPLYEMTLKMASFPSLEEIMAQMTAPQPA